MEQKKIRRQHPATHVLSQRAIIHYRFGEEEDMESSTKPCYLLATRALLVDAFPKSHPPQLVGSFSFSFLSPLSLPLSY